MKLSNIDMRTLNERAQRFFEESDQGTLNDYFGECKSIAEINETADALYGDFFKEDE